MLVGHFFYILARWLNWDTSFRMSDYAKSHKHWMWSFKPSPEGMWNAWRFRNHPWPPPFFIMLWSILEGRGYMMRVLPNEAHFPTHQIPARRTKFSKSFDFHSLCCLFSLFMLRQFSHVLNRICPFDTSTIQLFAILLHFGGAEPPQETFNYVPMGYYYLKGLPVLFLKIH